MKPTKQHIAGKALKLFNEKGFVNVRLQHIADAAFVSIGHLAYHFKNKDAILEYLYTQISAEMEKLLTDHKVLPLFTDLNRMLEEILAHQLRYRFFYLDSLEIIRAYPALAVAHKTHLRWQCIQLSFMLQFNVSRGAMALQQTPPDALAALIQQFIGNWLHNTAISYGVHYQVNDFLKDIWLLLYPYCTITGRNELVQENLFP